MINYKVSHIFHLLCKIPEHLNESIPIYMQNKLRNAVRSTHTGRQYSNNASVLKVMMLVYDVRVGVTVHRCVGDCG